MCQNNAIFSVKFLSWFSIKPTHHCLKFFLLREFAFALLVFAAAFTHVCPAGISASVKLASLYALSGGEGAADNVSKAVSDWSRVIPENAARSALVNPNRVLRSKCESSVVPNAPAYGANVVVERLPKCGSTLLANSFTGVSRIFNFSSTGTLPDATPKNSARLICFIESGI